MIGRGYRLIPLLGVLLLSACGSGEERSYRVDYSPEPPVRGGLYTFSVHPLHNPQRLHEVFAPLMHYLSRNIEGVEFRLEASRNYAAYNAKLYAAQHHFSLPNPYQTLKSLEHGYHVFGKMADDENFRGIILVRRDSGIRKPSDLKGKTVSFPAPTALAATLMPQYYLHSHGLDVNSDIDSNYVGSQESSIMNVFLGNSAAGATWPPPWRALSAERPELAEQLEVIWQTESLPNIGLVVREDVPEALVQRVGSLLFSLHESEEGRAILERMRLSRFEPADDEHYAPVREFLERFRAEVRAVE